MVEVSIAFYTGNEINSADLCLLHVGLSHRKLVIFLCLGSMCHNIDFLHLVISQKFPKL